MNVRNVLAGLALLPAIAVAQPTSPPAKSPAQQPAAQRIIQTKVQLQAGSGIFSRWPSGGRTWHHGLGFIEPLGLAEYWCGRDFPEQASVPQPDYLTGLGRAYAGLSDGQMLFCVYRTKDGDLYAYDSPIGVLHAYDAENDPRMEQTVNFVVGGTGAYRGATGIWLGVVEGRGAVTRPVPGEIAQVPVVLLKIMDGYIKLPVAP